jgi:hypothetical protein
MATYRNLWAANVEIARLRHRLAQQEAITLNWHELHIKAEAELSQLRESNHALNETLEELAANNDVLTRKLETQDRRVDNYREDMRVSNELISKQNAEIKQLRMAIVEQAIRLPRTPS